MRSAIAFLLLTCTAAAADSAPKRPDIVVCISDDHGWLDSTPFADTQIRTPNIERISKAGLTFTHAFVASPSCAPSRAALLTGLMPARNGAEANHTQPRADLRRLPQYLAELGYQTAAFGKVAHGGSAKDYKFDLVRSGTEPGAIEKFLRERDEARPLCLFVGFKDPHVPWAENDSYDSAMLQLPEGFVDTPQMRDSFARYATDVTNMDAELGTTYDLVRELLPQQTLFLYVSDHGPQLPFAKWNLYDSGVRVPLIAVQDGVIPRGTTTDALVSLVDLLPTLIEVAGGGPPASLDGKSFANALYNPAAQHREKIFLTHSGDGTKNVYPIRAVRTRDWKYILNLYPEYVHTTHIDQNESRLGLMFWSSWKEAAKENRRAAAIVGRYYRRPAEELYDLRHDPAEQHNLADDPQWQSVNEELRRDLESWMAQQHDNREVFNKPHLTED